VLRSEIVDTLHFLSLVRAGGVAAVAAYSITGTVTRT
jgi:hypothetical protein